MESCQFESVTSSDRLTEISTSRRSSESLCGVHTSSKDEDADAQVAIRKWFVFSTLKNAFGGSSDTTLTRLRELLKASRETTRFPADALYKSLGIEPRLNDAEIDRIMGYAYQGRSRGNTKPHLLALL
jgi:hypothetical protein